MTNNKRRDSNNHINKNNNDFDYSTNTTTVAATVQKRYPFHHQLTLQQPSISGCVLGVGVELGIMYANSTTKEEKSRV